MEDPAIRTRITRPSALTFDGRLNRLGVIDEGYPLSVPMTRAFFLGTLERKGNVKDTPRQDLYARGTFLLSLITLLRNVTS